ncbi:TonB-dependent receptor [Novipirellula artificiosorum]|uniref:Vitamin B12 transporter BtuB n=1 Tax=Novipirellula artificiosorum TaxID=2528016 RepID=A0A5C6DZJ4_9BACT|nr:TonB-dependent receptor [Novipirellula artificiosorum]TWU42042.1 Vitamin B12 transporter BtuB [Novipirellula artificiosorum]
MECDRASLCPELRLTLALLTLLVGSRLLSPPTCCAQIGLGIQLQTPVAPINPGMEDAAADRGAGQGRGTAEQAPNAPSPLAFDERINKLFGDVDQIEDLPAARRGLATSPAADAVFAAEAVGRKTRDIGDLLRQSKSAHGVAVQNRTPIITDTRVRGQRVGQVLASGSYWAPARMDLDTMMNKLDSRLIEDVILIKGPYAARYGPGFRFVDMDFIKSPRFENGSELHGLTSVTYNTNGQQWAGRQSAWGGSQDYGYYVSYGHQTGNDYETGEDDFYLPTSYKSRDIFAAIGVDLTCNERLEFNLLRLDQTDVEFPGLVFDLNFLVTDGYEVTYTNEAPGFADLFVAEVWYNRTRFEGDTLRAGKNWQIPSLQETLEPSDPALFDGYGITDGDALSGGYRLESTYFTCNGHLTFGTDMIVLNQELNDIEPNAPADDNNFPIPRSHSVDIGLFVEDVEQINECLTVTAGARLDGIFTDSTEYVDGVPVGMSELYDAELDQDFVLGAAYLTGEYKLRPGWTVDAGMGTAQRQPTLTEMYSESAFIGSLQRGLTFLQGDPELNPERLFQLDVGTRFEDRDVSFGLHGYYSWIKDYITYDLFDPAGTVDGFQQGASMVNTDLATIAGFETYGQYAASDYVTLFGIMSYVEGRDHHRTNPARRSEFIDRSGNLDVESEPLPGISPLETRLGILLQDPSPEKRWGIELMARIVDNQDRVAATLEEIETPGFTIYTLRTYRRIDQWLLTAGVENLTDKFYREHIDYRSGYGVYRPGIGFYVGCEVAY